MYSFTFPTSGRTRIEHDLLGDKAVPVEALFGVQTLRGIENFKISTSLLSHYPAFIKGLGYIKMGAALANHEVGLLPTPIKDAIVAACQELIDGKHHEQKETAEYDRIRTEFLNALGIVVIRFTNDDVNHRFKCVCDIIQERVPFLRPTPPS